MLRAVASTRDLSIRPLGLGEIVDRSIAVTRRHFRPLFAAMLVIEAPALALGRLQQVRAVEVLALLADPTRAAGSLRGAATFFGELLAVLLLLQLGATAVAAAIVAPALDPSRAGAPSRARRVLAVGTAALVQAVALV